MNLKKIKILAIINIFILSFISHFLYTLFPNILVSFFFPVNESIAEHMKILFTTTLIYEIIDYLLLKINNIKINNFKFQLFLTSTLSIPIFLIIYIPIYYIFKENLVITLLIMILTYTICQIISYKLLTSKNYIYLNYISIPLIILIYIIFIILTYNPPQIPLFYDNINKHYGIKRTYQ